MGRWLLAMLIVVLAVIGALYWWIYRPQEVAYRAAQQQATTSGQETLTLKSRVADLEAIRDQLQRTSTDLQQKVQETEKELLTLRSTQDELLGELKQEIADKQVQVERIKDQLRVDMVDEVLFDSGETKLKPAGIEVLKKVGAVLKKTSNRRIEVQGHTDNVPIRGVLAKTFATNWELSAARATNVARFLQDEAQVDPAMLSASAFSEYQPRATNDSDEGRRSNRRIEILLGSPMKIEKASAAN
jgi:chemotaxis protein MotB